MIKEILEKFSQPILEIGPILPKIILGLLIGVLVIKIILLVLENIFKVGRVPKALSEIFLSVIAFVVWVMLFSELAKSAGLNSIAVTISGSLVVLGFALANGATSLTADIISGVFLAKDRDFEIGYNIETGGITGRVKKIDVRKVRLTGEDGKVFVIPNANLDKNGWTVIDRGDK